MLDKEFVMFICFVQAFNSATDDHINRSIFKDKKLNHLWSKAETSGFTSEELAALKEEFMHHQNKIDQYYELLNDLDGGKKDGYKSKIFFYNNHKVENCLIQATDW